MPWFRHGRFAKSMVRLGGMWLEDMLTVGIGVSTAADPAPDNPRLRYSHQLVHGAARPPVS